MTNKDTPKPKRMDAFYAKEGKEGKSYFTKVGAMFPHKDGNGYNLQLDAQTPDGRYVLRTPKERVKALKNGQGQSQDQEHDR